MSTIDSTWVCEVPVSHQKMGFSVEGVCITNCPWPNRDFTLAVVEHAHRNIVADRFVVSQLMTTTEK